MNYGLIGEKLGHSFSKEIHEKIADYQYEIKEIPPNGLDLFMKNKDFKGINVTIPYKKSVIPYLDFIDESAEKIGAVNTVVNNNGRLFGYNTDFSGLLSLINKYTESFSGKSVMILGDGGASCAATAVAEHLDAEKIYVVSLYPNDSKISYADAAEKYNNVNVIINTTPVGMFPNVNGSAISLDNFNNLELVIDVVYNPVRTDLVLSAQSKGIPAEGGLYMLVSQAVFAAGYFTGKKFGCDITDKVYNELLQKKQNIVLVGMPGSGKTTIGNYIAKITGKQFIDTDELIESRTEEKITDIFAKYGENAFRDIESKVIYEASLKNGCIISTGGGAVLRNENILNLKHNGLIFFLDRDLSELVPTDDRPLASTKQAIINRYYERIDIYNSVCDCKVKVVNPEITGKEILNYFNKRVQFK